MGILNGFSTSSQDATLIIPTGAVFPFAGTVAPSGYLLCYGQAISRTTYSTLFATLSTTYGAGDGSTTFNLPDLRGRAVAGKDDMGGSAANRITAAGSGITGTTLGANGGTETHTLTGAQSGTPSHTHGVTDPGHFHALQSNANLDYTRASIYRAEEWGSPNSPLSRNTDTKTTGISINNATAANASQAHQNTQPTMILNYIIKT